MSWLRGWKRLRWILGVAGSFCIHWIGSQVVASGSYPNPDLPSRGLGTLDLHWTEVRWDTTEKFIAIAVLWIILFIHSRLFGYQRIQGQVTEP
jgi:hypothetical protein